MGIPIVLSSSIDTSIFSCFLTLFYIYLKEKLSSAQRECVTMYMKKAKLLCPKCSSHMEKVEYEGVKIERCKKCKGIWFDMMEKDELKAKHGSESVDSGDKDVGKESDKKKNVNCPKCLTPMIRKADIEQKHIVYEYCNSCHGAFFDAGEFKDFKEETILDYIKKIFIKK